MKTQALVLTCGNPQRGDDGIAGQVADALRAGFCDAGTVIRSYHQWVPEIAEALSETEVAIFVDASAELQAGEVHSQRIVARPASPQALTHSMTPSGLLALAKQLYGTEPGAAYLVTIGGDSFAMCEELSDVARRTIPLALDRVKAVLSGVSVPHEAGAWQ